MSDDSNPTSRDSLPPVRMALRVIGRHGHRGGPHLARAVSAARTPKHLAASTRLAHPATGAPAPAPAFEQPAAPYVEAPYAEPSYAEPTWPSSAPAESVAREPAFDRPAVPGMSDFASEFLFGDRDNATSGLTSMAAAEKLPDNREAKLARRKARGALDVSRAAKILEGPASGPEGPEETALPGMDPDPAPERSGQGLPHARRGAEGAQRAAAHPVGCCCCGGRRRGRERRAYALR